MNGLAIPVCCTELTYQIYLGISQGVTFNLIPNYIESCYGQISIEIATYSFPVNSHAPDVEPILKRGYTSDLNNVSLVESPRFGIADTTNQPKYREP